MHYIFCVCVYTFDSNFTVNTFDLLLPFVIFLVKALTERTITHVLSVYLFSSIQSFATFPPSIRSLQNNQKSLQKISEAEHNSSELSVQKKFTKFYVYQPVMIVVL